jgi:hypothetical protein
VCRARSRRFGDIEHCAWAWSAGGQPPQAAPPYSASRRARCKSFTHARTTDRLRRGALERMGGQAAHWQAGRLDSTVAPAGAELENAVQVPGGFLQPDTGWQQGRFSSVRL